MLRIWGRPNSYNVQKVLWLLDEISIEYDHINIGSTAGDLQADNFLSKNPHGQIPVIQDEDDIVWESNTILRYLAAKYGSNTFWNESPSKRTHYERWMDWELAALQPDFLGLFWGFYRTPNEQHDLNKIKHYTDRCRRNTELLDQHLSDNSYVAGELFSLADIAVGTSFYRYYNMGITISEYKNVTKWYQKLMDRKSYQDKIAIPFDDLRGRLVF